MLSEDIPTDVSEFVSLYFGPMGVPRNIPEWVRKNKTYTLEVKGYVGLEPDTWHMTKWDDAYYLIYVSDDKLTYTVGLHHEGSGRIPLRWRDKADPSYNGGKGWCYDRYYAIVRPTAKCFSDFINWDYNPMEGKQ